jgi:hypothetical protein
VSTLLEIAGLPFAIKVELRALRWRLLRLFQHFPETRRERFATVTVEQRTAGLHLTVCNTHGVCVVDDPFSGSDVETWFKSRLLCAIFRMRRAEIIGLHGCSFVYNGTAHLVVGPRGAGKTTLTALACRAGAQYLSDDIVLIDAASYRVLPYPILMSFKSSSHTGRTRFELDRGAVARGAATCIGSWIFPVYAANADSALHALPTSGVLMQLLRNFRNAPMFGPAAIDQMARLARMAPAYQLNSNSRSSTAALLDEVLQHRKSEACLLTT